jgi:hypothetical protein
VFEVFNRPRRQVQIDLASVRDTLLYIESDLGQSPDMYRLAAAIRSALAEIEKLEAADAGTEPRPITASRFLPMQQ